MNTKQKTKQRQPKAGWQCWLSENTEWGDTKQHRLTPKSLCPNLKWRFSSLLVAGGTFPECTLSLRPCHLLSPTVVCWGGGGYRRRLTDRPPDGLFCGLLQSWNTPLDMTEVAGWGCVTWRPAVEGGAARLLNKNLHPNHKTLCIEYLSC